MHVGRLLASQPASQAAYRNPELARTALTSSSSCSCLAAGSFLAPAVAKRKIGAESCCLRGTTARAQARRGSKPRSCRAVGSSTNLSSPGSVSTRLYRPVVQGTHMHVAPPPYGAHLLGACSRGQWGPSCGLPLPSFRGILLGAVEGLIGSRYGSSEVLGSLIQVYTYLHVAGCTIQSRRMVEAQDGRPGPHKLTCGCPCCHCQ